MVKKEKHLFVDLKVQLYNRFCTCYLTQKSFVKE